MGRGIARDHIPAKAVGHVWCLVAGGRTRNAGKGGGADGARRPRGKCGSCGLRPDGCYTTHEMAFPLSVFDRDPVISVISRCDTIDSHTIRVPVTDAGHRVIRIYSGCEHLISVTTLAKVTVTHQRSM